MAEVLWLRQIRLDQVDVISNLRKSFDQEKMTELEASVRAHGVLQPILVAQRDDGNYRLVAGERRVRAARAVGLEGIPAMVAEMTEAEIVEAQVTENLQREDVSAIEEAEGFRQLVEVCGYTQQKVADKIGVSQAQVANRLRLLRLPAAVKDKVIARQMTAGHAMALLRLLPDGKAKPSKLFDSAVKAMAEGHVTVAGAQKYVDGEIWSHARSLRKAKAEDINTYGAPYWAYFDVDGLCLKNPKAGRCGYVVEATNPWEAKPKVELRCINPDCWQKNQDAAYRVAVAQLKKAEDEKKKTAAKKPHVTKAKEPKTPTAKTPPAPPLDNVDLRVVQRLGKAAWAARLDKRVHREHIEFRRECYLPLEALLKHFADRCDLGASNMPATLEWAHVELVGEGVAFQSTSGTPATFETKNGRFQFKAGAYNSLTIEDAPSASPVYYCAETTWSTIGTLNQRLAIALGRGRVLVIVASDSVMMRRELRPKWYNLLQALPASPVSCIPEVEPVDKVDDRLRAPGKELCSTCDGDCGNCPNDEEDGEAPDAAEIQDDSLVKAVGYQAGDSVTQPGYQGPDGRVFIVDDGLAQGEEWGVFEVRPNNALHRVKSIPMTPDPEKAEETLEAWAERKRMTPVTVERSADAMATRPREVEEADSDPEDNEDDTVQPPRVGGEDIIGPHDGGKPLACKDCGLRPCGPDTRKICKGEAAG